MSKKQKVLIWDKTEKPSNICKENSVKRVTDQLKNQFVSIN